MRKIAISLAFATTLGACEAVQTTSGADYLARYDAAIAAAGVPATGSSGGSGSVDQMVREAAAVEPILTLPARLGIARLEGGALTAIPPEEAALWADLAGRHRALGEFVVINPLVARLSAAASGYRPYVCSAGRPGYARQIEEVVNGVRMGAARQHVDAMLIYEVAAASSKQTTILGFMDVTIIGGAILPTRSIEAEGLGSALLVDVRNGYPYGTASAVVELDELSPSWGSDHRRNTLRAEAAQQVVERLVADIDAMLAELTRRLEAKAGPAAEG